MQRERYLQLLERAYAQLPETVKEHSRFIIPMVISRIQGKITVITNLGDVSKAVNRDPEMIAKFLMKELGTSGMFDGQQLILKGQFRQSQIQSKYESFLAQFVICPECGKPDTKIIKEDRISFLKCEACGSKNPIGGIRVTKIKIEKPEVGEEIIVPITRIEGNNGIAHVGNYRIIVRNVKEEGKVKARVTEIVGNEIYAEYIKTVK